MPRDQEYVSVPKGEWVELTDNDVTDIMFMVLSGRVLIRRDGSNQPATDEMGWPYGGGQGERCTLSDISKANTGARLWAFGLTADGARVMVDHA